MTDQQHSITPPQWQMDAWQARIETMGADLPAILLEVAQWGADQELGACCTEIDGWSVSNAYGYELVSDLRAARRPKPPSLAEKALKRAAMLEELAISCGHGSDGILRRALERLQELEGGND